MGGPITEGTRPRKESEVEDKSTETHKTKMQGEGRKKRHGVSRNSVTIV